MCQFTSSSISTIIMRNGAVIFFVIALAVTVIGGKDKLQQTHVDCQADPAYYVDENLIHRAVVNGEQVDESKLGPHIFCMYLKGGIQGHNGDIIEDGLRALATKRTTSTTAAEELMRDCGKTSGGTPGETAVALARCIHKHVHLDIF